MCVRLAEALTIATKFRVFQECDDVSRDAITDTRNAAELVLKPRIGLVTLRVG